MFRGDCDTPAGSQAVYVRDPPTGRSDRWQLGPRAGDVRLPRRPVVEGLLGPQGVVGAAEQAEFDSEGGPIADSRSDFTHSTYDLCGVDFVFSTEGTFRLRCAGHEDSSIQSWVSTICGITLRQVESTAILF